MYVPVLAIESLRGEIIESIAMQSGLQQARIQATFMDLAITILAQMVFATLAIHTIGV
jgi:hypothetical protein